MIIRLRVLIVVAAALGWWRRHEMPHSPWWGVATLVWVIVQGLFGKYTVTLKLAEIFFTTAGNRVMNIAINGTTVASTIRSFEGDRR